MVKGYLKIDAPIKEDDKIYLIIRNNAKKKTYFLLSQEIMPNNIAYTDSLSSFAALNISGFHHHRINHSKQFANQQTISTVLKTFKIRQKCVLRKYNGVDRKSFPLFLKECEFRFNFGTPSQ